MKAWLFRRARTQGQPLRIRPRVVHLSRPSSPESRREVRTPGWFGIGCRSQLPATRPQRLLIPARPAGGLGQGAPAQSGRRYRLGVELEARDGYVRVRSDQRHWSPCKIEDQIRCRPQYPCVRYGRALTLSHAAYARARTSAAMSSASSRLAAMRAPSRKSCDRTWSTNASKLASSCGFGGNNCGSVARSRPRGGEGHERSYGVRTPAVDIPG